jgi:hypothetical protein
MNVPVANNRLPAAVINGVLARPFLLPPGIHHHCEDRRPLSRHAYT